MTTRRSFRLAGSLLALVLCLAAPARTDGFGANFTYTRSMGEVEDTDDFFPDVDTDSNDFEVGVSYDSNLAGDRLFNYRISANLAVVEQDLELLGTDFEIQGLGLSINQLFGFGVVRMPQMRVFLGPAIQIGYVNFDDDDQGIDFEEHLFTGSIGPELGANFHVSHNVTLSLTGFYRYGFQLQYYDTPFDTFGSDGVLLGDQHRFGLSATLFFRLDSDQFE
jgi:hypothetical protein